MGKEVLTEELLQDLLSKPNVESFIDDKSLSKVSFTDLLNKFMVDKNLNKTDIIKQTNLNQTHAYQIFSGQRGASRDKVLQLAVAMNLNLKETNRLLHASGVSSLYCKSRRDAIIIFCIENQYSLQKIDEELHKFNEETLSAE